MEVCVFPIVDSLGGRDAIDLGSCCCAFAVARCLSSSPLEGIRSLGKGYGYELVGVYVMLCAGISFVPPVAVLCCGLRDVSKRRRRRLPLSRRACLASRWQKSAPRKRACDSRWQGPFAGETTRWSPNLPTFSIMCQMMTWHSDTGTESGFEGAQHDPHLQIPPPAWY